ncbi:hypothetical protein CGBL_0120710 [Corynebacterium glutamicum]|nr:hypothetical protein CGBL_0120710 [Corynebacterium glutamicum]
MSKRSTMIGRGIPLVFVVIGITGNILDILGVNKA